MYVNWLSFWNANYSTGDTLMVEWYWHFSITFMAAINLWDFQLKLSLLVYRLGKEKIYLMVEYIVVSIKKKNRPYISENLLHENSYASHLHFCFIFR